MVTRTIEIYEDSKLVKTETYEVDDAVIVAEQAVRDLKKFSSLTSPTIETVASAIKALIVYLRI